MNEIILISKSIGASAVEADIGELTVSEKEKITVLEIFFYMKGEGKITGYLKQRKIVEVDKDALPTYSARVVQNLELVAGDKYAFKGTDTSGSTNKMIVGLIIDRTITT
jgi:hypothetical protein